MVRNPEELDRWMPSPSGPRSFPLSAGCVTISECQRDEFLGLYIRSGLSRERPSRGPHMEIRIPQDNPVYTILHECFHLIHFELLCRERGASERGLLQLENVMTYIRKTSAWRLADVKTLEAELRYDKLKDSEGIGEDDLRQVRELAEIYRYVASDEEWLARSYMQVVGSKTDRRQRRTSVADHIKRTDILDIRQYISPHWVRGLEKEFRKLWYELGWIPG